MSGFYDTTQNTVLHGGSGFLYAVGGLPSPDDLSGLDYAYCAEPFVNVPAKAGVDLSGMDYAFCAEPFIGNE